MWKRFTAHSPHGRKSEKGNSGVSSERKAWSAVGGHTPPTPPGRLVSVSQQVCPFRYVEFVGLFKAENMNSCCVVGRGRGAVKMHEARHFSANVGPPSDDHITSMNSTKKGYRRKEKEKKNKHRRCLHGAPRGAGDRAHPRGTRYGR